MTRELISLGISCIDKLYQHRMNPNTLIEETVNCLLEQRTKVKSKLWTIRMTPEELERAHKLIPNLCYSNRKELAKPRH